MPWTISWRGCPESVRPRYGGPATREHCHAAATTV
jgi:hypothetical protein